MNYLQLIILYQSTIPKLPYRNHEKTILYLPFTTFL